MRQRIERILNRPLAVKEDEVLIVKAVVVSSREERAWRAAIETDNGQRRATRTLEAASCDELANATALFVAVLIEPHVDSPGASQPSAREQAPRSSPEGAAPPTPTAPSPPDRGRRADSDAGDSETTDSARPVWSIGASGAGLSGLLPAWEFGLAAHGAFAWKAFRSSAGASLWLPSRATVDANGNQGANFELYAAHAELCIRHTAPVLTPALCSGAQLSSLRGKGFGPGVEPEARSATFVSLSAGAAMFFRYSNRLSFVLEADALFPLGARRFVFAGSEPALVFGPAIGIRLSGGAEFALF